MLTILGSPLLLFGVVPAVLIAMGFGIGAAIGRTPQKWKIALGLLLAPPALVGVFYFLASQGGCAGGTCMGPMIGLFLLGGLAALVMLIALGIFLQTAFSALAQWSLGLVAGGAAALLAGCGLLGGNSYHFKMTVEAETSQGMKAGSSVYEVYADKRLALTSEEAEISDGLRGQALVVDLPQGPVFALLKQDGNSGLYLHRAVTVALSGRMFKGLDDLIAMTGKLGGAFAGTARAELPRENWPMMVRFRDINDPASVEKVEPEAIGIRRIIVETTGDAVSTGIAKRLAWLGNEGAKGNVVSGPTTNHSLQETIRFYDFGSEFK